MNRSRRIGLSNMLFAFYSAKKGKKSNLFFKSQERSKWYLQFYNDCATVCLEVILQAV